jgi:hypothetical protein
MSSGWWISSETIDGIWERARGVSTGEISARDMELLWPILKDSSGEAREGVFIDGWDGSWWKLGFGWERSVGQISSVSINVEEKHKQHKQHNARKGRVIEARRSSRRYKVPRALERIDLEMEGEVAESGEFFWDSLKMLEITEAPLKWRARLPINPTR